MAKNKKKEPPDQSYILFVEDMDGDVYEDWISVIQAVTHAFANGAKRVEFELWPP